MTDLRKPEALVAAATAQPYSDSRIAGIRTDLIAFAAPGESNEVTQLATEVGSKHYQTALRSGYLDENRGNGR